VLLAKRTKPPFKWSLPGGSLEAGETAAQAAIREAHEEVSAEIEIVAKAGEREVVIRDQDGNTVRRYLISVFAARLKAGDPKPGPEASEIGWFSLDEIAALDATDGLADSVRVAEQALGVR
jgi:8-oxo-dGTP diphosphatase